MIYQNLAADNCKLGQEQIASLAQRIMFTKNYLIALIITIFTLYVASFLVFRRYDVR